MDKCSICGKEIEPDKDICNECKQKTEKEEDYLIATYYDEGVAIELKYGGADG